MEENVNPTGSPKGKAAAVVPYISSGGGVPTTLHAFLQSKGLQGLSETLHGAGFLSINDVLDLTPRKYELAGVPEKVGTRLRLGKSRAKLYNITVLYSIRYCT